MRKRDLTLVCTRCSVKDIHQSISQRRADRLTRDFHAKHDQCERNYRDGGGSE